SVRLHDFERADQGEIGEVLVVNRVELIEFNQPKQVRKFKCQDAVGLQQDLQAFHEVVEVGHLCQDVVSDNEVGSAAFATLAAGSIPSTGTPKRTKYCSR